MSDRCPLCEDLGSAGPCKNHRMSNFEFELKPLDELSKEELIEEIKLLAESSLRATKEEKHRREKLEATIEALKADLAQLSTGDIRPVPTSNQVVNAGLKKENERQATRIEYLEAGIRSLLKDYSGLAVSHSHLFQPLLGKLGIMLVDPTKEKTNE